MTYMFNLVNGSFERLDERLAKNVAIFPFIGFIAFQMVLLLTAYILNGSNHRAGNPSNPIDYQAEPFPDVPLWFSVTPVGHDIVVTTPQRRVYRWPQSTNTLKPLKEFVEDLRSMVEIEVRSIALKNDASLARPTAVISADQHLTYAHLKPIVLALAEVGIRDYALETRLTHVGEK
jgi:hypothetical protein